MTIDELIEELHTAKEHGLLGNEEIVVLAGMEFKHDPYFPAALEDTKFNSEHVYLYINYE